MIHQYNAKIKLTLLNKNNNKIVTNLYIFFSIFLLKIKLI